MLFEVKGGKGEAEALRQSILKSNEGTQVQIKNSGTTIHIMGIDGDIDMNKLEETIQKYAGDAGTNDIKITSLRPNQWGGQNATVVLQSELAKQMVKQGFIKIGWTPCRVRARIDIARCYRCLQFGHHSSECKGEDNSNLCLNCGKEGHKARECRNISYCLTCKKEGHRAEQLKCPHYKKMITDKARDMEKGDRGHPSSSKKSGEKDTEVN